MVHEGVRARLKSRRPTDGAPKIKHGQVLQQKPVSEGKWPLLRTSCRAPPATMAREGRCRVAIGEAQARPKQQPPGAPIVEPRTVFE